MEALVHQRKSSVLILMKQTQNFGDHSYLLVDGKEIFKVKADNFFFHFPTQICLWSITNRSGAAESREV